MPNPIPMSPITKYAAKAAFRAPVLIEESYRLSGSPGSLEDVSVAYALTQQAKPTRIRKIPTRVAIALPPDLCLHPNRAQRERKRPFTMLFPRGRRCSSRRRAQQSGAAESRAQ